MSTVIFCGPSLASAERAAFEAFEFRAPVRQGELFAAARDGAHVIGVIDGYFDGQPAVWHKEILWALSQHIAVFGASSMGALRAAELHSFGMRGIGKIFEAYRDGVLTDDDEVALIHGPAETGYVHLSEPMVNIRAAIEQAVGEQIVDSVVGDRLVAAAKAQFYQDRSWKSVLAVLGQDPARERLSAWLEQHKLDQKRDDALAMLEAIQVFERRREQAGPANFSFEWTENWVNAPWRIDAAADAEESTGEESAILNELRLEGFYQQVRREALLRLLASAELERMGTSLARPAIMRETTAFRMRRGLLRQSEVRSWAEQNDTDLARFERLIFDEAAIEELARLRDVGLRPAMLDRLRQMDNYVALRDRAMAKRSARDGGRPKLPRVQIMSWYFGKRLGIPVPEDLGEYAVSVGIGDVDSFHDLVAAEYAFTHAKTASNDSGAPTERPLT